MGYRVGPVALWVHYLFFCANCLACSHSVRDRNLHTLNKEVADCEFFRAQAPCDFRPEYPQAFLHLKKCSALLNSLAEILQWSRRKWSKNAGLQTGCVFGGNGLEKSASLLNSLSVTLWAHLEAAQHP